MFVDQLPMHPRLGRMVRHDPRSATYAIPVLPKSAIASQRWARRVPIFDQGQVGSCTGNAAAGWLATDDTVREGFASLPDGTKVDEQLALSIYSAAETIDGDGPYPPNDNGSSGLSVAKVLKARGLASGYTHAFSAAAVYSALQTGPGLLGIPWYQSMFDTDAAGHIKVDAKSGVAGGHEIIVPRLDVTTGGVIERIWIDNSWGASWGVGGSGYFEPPEFVGLLADQGDFTVPIAVLPPTPPQPSGDAFQAALDSVPGLDAWLTKTAAKHSQTVPQYLAALAARQAHIKT